jgi:uncharacterized membrane protein YqaE (UPF0057 family)
MSASPGRIAAAIFLPPLGVYLARGAERDFWARSAKRDFWIACGLTVLGWLPGAGFALWTVLKGDSFAVAA